jgi:hypothetical protein
VKSKADMKAGADTKDAKPSAQSEPKKPATTGQAEPKSADPKSQAQSKDAPAAKTQAQDTKQAPASKTQAQDSKQPAAKSAQDNKAMDSKSTAQDSKSTTTTGQGAAGTTQAAGAVNLTTEQKSTIRTTVLQGSSVPRVQRNSINFNISVGTVVPRTVHFVEVPDTLVRIHPAWRGYRYFVVDEEIIIVEPSTFKIIAVLNV